MAFSSDTLVADIRKYSSERSFKALVDVLQTQEDSLVETDPSVLDTIIECLSSNAHSLGVLAALNGKLNREQVAWTNFILQMRDFITNFSTEQIKHSPLTFCNLIHKFTEQLCLKKQAREGIPILLLAIDKYSPSPTTLTAIHCDLIQLCLMAKNLKPALPYLEKEYTTLFTENEQFDVKHVLLFYYYGGMVYTCLHDYLRALLFLTVCLTMPTVAVSAIMVAAYKKYCLVSLLKFGKEISLPKYSSHIVERALKPLCGPYIQVAKFYSSGKASSLQSAIVKFQDIFNADGNTGLIQRLSARVHRHSVQRLTHTFLTVGLADVSTKLELSSEQEAEKYIRDMIEDGEVHATLDQAARMVSFTENPENFDTLDTVRLMDSQLREAISLEKKLGAFDKELAGDPRYIERLMRSGGDEDPLFPDEPL
ncbi:COP9 signalosome complex subunit 3-like isoform X2 [Halichondria panicea]|uniref:COP9 signalosome complex subunit 3-like isoform X2 n=1 Tax=Halichondria panicea TaxID=6063 RepID=UPI00312B4347